MGVGVREGHAACSFLTRPGISWDPVFLANYDCPDRIIVARLYVFFFLRVFVVRVRFRLCRA